MQDLNENQLAYYQVYLQHLRQGLMDPLGLNTLEVIGQGGLFVESPLLEYYTGWNCRKQENEIQTREHSLQALKRHKYLLLFGGSGTGKSTLLRYMAYQQALSNSQILPLFLSFKALAHGGLGHSPQPTLLSLVDYLCERRESRAFSYLQQAFEYWQAVQATNSQDFKGWLIELFQTQKVTLYLDGWDELPAGLRENFISWLQALQQAGLGMVLSSRAKEYLPLQGLEVWTPTLDLQRQQQYVRAYFAQQQTPDTTQAVIESLPSAPRLFCQPLFLTLLCRFWQQVKQAFKTPTDGLRFCITQLLLQTNKPEQHIQLLSYLAFRMQCSHSPLNPQNLLAWLQFPADADKPFLRNPGLQALLPPRTASIEALLEDLLASGLLQTLPGLSDSYTFVHKVFQEYLCADFMVQNMSQDALHFFFSHKCLGPAPQTPPAAWGWDFIQQPFQPSQAFRDAAQQQGVNLPESVALYPVMYFSQPDWQAVFCHLTAMQPALWRQAWTQRYALVQTQGLESILPFGAEGYWLTDELEYLLANAFLPETLTPHLVAGLRAENDWLRTHCAKALSQQATLPEQIIEALIAGLREDNDWLRTVCTQLLSQQAKLPEQATCVLVAGLRDEHDGFRTACVQALDQQLHLPEAATEMLIAGLRDENDWLRKSCIKLLRQQARLPEQAMEALIAGLWETSKIRISCAQALSQQTHLSEQAIDMVLAGLKDADYWIRISCVKLLSQQTALPEQAVAALIAGFRGTGEIRALCAKVFSQQFRLPEQAIEVFIAGLGDADDWVRITCAKILYHQLHFPEQAMDAFVAGLRDELDWVRRTCAKALGQLAHLPEPAIEALIAGLRDPTDLVKYTCAESLSQQRDLPEQAIGELIAGLRDENDWIRTACEKALDRQSQLSEQTLHTLIEEIKSESAISVACAHIFYSHRQANLPEQVIHALIAGSKTANDDRLRSACISALKFRVDLPEAAIDAFVAGLKEGSDSIRRACAAVLRHQAALPEQAVAALIAGLWDADSSVSRDCAEALSQQADLPQQAIGALTAGLRDEADLVRTACARALGKQTDLPPQAIDALIENLKDKTGLENLFCATALSPQPHLPEAAIRKLIEGFGDNISVSKKCAALLGQQAQLPEYAIQALIAQLRDESDKVRRICVNTLGKQASLSEQAIAALITGFREADVWAVKTYAAVIIKYFHTTPRLLGLLCQQALADFKNTQAEIIFKLPPQQLHALFIAQSVGLLPSWR